MKAGEVPRTYEVVCLRASGERLVISTHASEQSANVVVRLIQNCAGFSDIHIESGGRRVRRCRRQLSHEIGGAPPGDLAIEAPGNGRSGDGAARATHNPLIER
jgi:hypothetical protein